MASNPQQSHECSDLEIYADNLCAADSLGDTFVPVRAGSALMLQSTTKCEELRIPASRGACLTLMYEVTSFPLYVEALATVR